MSSNDAVLIGLSFGSTYSSIATVGKDGNPIVVADEDGHRMIPVQVTVQDDGSFLIGNDSKNVMHKCKDSTIFNFKKLMGLKSIEEAKSVCSDEELLSLAENEGVLGYKINNKFYSVESLVKVFLQRLAQSASSYTGSSKLDTVASLPYSYTDNQRKEFIKIATDAGFEIKQIINECTASLLAYVNNSEEQSNQSCIVLDFGGSSTKFTLATISNGLITIIDQIIDEEINGKIIDKLLVEYMIKEFKKKTKLGIESANHRAMAKLKTASESTKKNLSKATSAPCSIESLVEGLDLNVSINRSRFELMISKTLKKISTNVNELMNKTGYNTTTIDSFYLVGGCSRIPKIKRQLEAFASDQSIRIYDSLHSDETVPIGCIQQASILRLLDLEHIDIMEKTTQTKEYLQFKHTTATIGIKTSQNTFLPIIQKNTPLPCRRKYQFKPQPTSSVVVELYEGEQTSKTETVKTSDDEGEASSYELVHHEWRETKKIAQLVLKQIKKGENELELLVTVGPSGKLTATLKDKTTDQKDEIN